jgi:hypothetical protein
MELKDLITIALFVGSGLSADNLPFKIDPSSRQIKDAYGRSVLLHGVNMVHKDHPYLPISGRAGSGTHDFISDEEIDDLVAHGTNFVRFGILWRAVEISPGVYN